MFKRIAIFLGLRLLKTYLLDKIEYAPLQGFVGANYRRLEEVAVLVTDSNPEDQEQLKALWESERAAFVSEGLDTVQAILSQEVKDQDLLAIINEVIDAIREGGFGDEGEARLAAKARKK